ncbi:hypothetical protein [Planomonospora sp. ID67723]|uniref:hypothetical protein n=1 Tax=Planomonospora sp. ID67723 TaxID=2738134 RepID=UPI0027DBF8DC|nr:hypothetical protein [Planomonospora sp. ID67723]
MVVTGGVAGLDARHQMRGEGREALATALEHLLAAGYATRERSRDEVGRMMWETVLRRLPEPVLART